MVTATLLALIFIPSSFTILARRDARKLEKQAVIAG
jgi:hypothetical protein